MPAAFKDRIGGHCALRYDKGSLAAAYLAQFIDRKCMETANERCLYGFDLNSSAIKKRSYRTKYTVIKYRTGLYSVNQVDVGLGPMLLMKITEQPNLPDKEDSERGIVTFSATMGNMRKSISVHYTLLFYKLQSAIRH